MGHGGARKGAGKKKGTKWPSTLAKEAAREILRDMVKAALTPMTEAQIANATGVKHLMLRDPKTGKFERVKDEAGIDAALKSEGEAVWIYTKDPNVQSFQDLMDRTLDKPSQPVAVEHSGAVDVVQRLDEARKRLNQARKRP